MSSLPGEKHVSASLNLGMFGYSASSVLKAVSVKRSTGPGVAAGPNDGDA